MRDKVEQPWFQNKREEIILKTVKSEMMKDNIGYIRISMFDEDTGKDSRMLRAKSRT